MIFKFQIPIDMQSSMKNIVRGKLKQFDVALKNQPGTLADLAELLANSGVNIKAIATESSDNGAGKARLVTEDEKTTRAALERGRFPFVESEILHIGLLDRPGELAKIARMLTKGKVNIDSVFILGKNDGGTSVAMKVSDLNAAKRILG